MNTRQIDSFENFQHVTKGYNIEINNNQLDLFKRYYKILLEWNKKINLISRRGEDSIIEKHFLDSIVFLPEIENLINHNQGRINPAPTNLLDIGSGGGFPAIPLAIMKPDWDFVLCESIKKKAGFLTTLVKELNLEKRVTIINDRVETLSNNQFDFITARAIAKLDILIKYALPLLKKDGHLLAYKAKDIDDEIKTAEEIIKKNKLKLKIFSKEINGVERKLIVIRHCEEST
ncbi:MAG: 16S rRNA (guanine(527)-N(7))-methyltransferase RsmG [Candidatus Melainabacteria bacterium]|nr:16S rRNA (guanine(527)-N(7))-methyltransferase RsmG [Candidatus Melainabacteria bacterium]